MPSLNKFLEKFRNLKSDAVPRPPRPTKTKEKQPTPIENEEENNENVNSSNEPEEILVESDDEVENEKPKFKFFKTSEKAKKPKKGKQDSSFVNTQGTNVINVVNSQNIRWGNDYYMGPAYMYPTHKPFQQEDEEAEVEVKKCNDIKLLLEAKIKPEHEYLDHICKNLGKNWQKFFIKMGYSKNRIETMVIDTEKYGVSEARYKLFLDWIENEEDPSLGRLATLLWKEGERQLVKELALLYKQSRKG